MACPYDKALQKMEMNTKTCCDVDASQTHVLSERMYTMCHDCMIV